MFLDGCASCHIGLRKSSFELKSCSFGGTVDIVTEDKKKGTVPAKTIQHTSGRSDPNQKDEPLLSVSLIHSDYRRVSSTSIHSDRILGTQSPSALSCEILTIVLKGEIPCTQLAMSCWYEWFYRLAKFVRVILNLFAGPFVHPLPTSFRPLFYPPFLASLLTFHTPAAHHFYRSCLLFVRSQAPRWASDRLCSCSAATRDWTCCSYT